jgi:DNA-binding response OmpR family regulator
MKKILVVDDEPEIVELTKKRLERQGYAVITAFDGVEGIKKVGQEKPDLILLDIVMPKQDGLSMFYQLKKDEATRNIPVILLTAKGETSSVLDAQKLGVTEYFIKPYDWDALLECIKGYLAMK